MIDFRNLAKWFSRPPQATKPTLKKCAACGAELACGAATQGCWCQEIETTEAQRDELSKKYQGCLCRACLRK